MAKVFGSAGEYAGRQSVEAFKRMFLKLLILATVAAFCADVLITMIGATRGGAVQFILALTIGLFLFMLLRDANRRIEGHETERLNWRKGALGEYEVGQNSNGCLTNNARIYASIGTEGKPLLHTRRRTR